MRGDLVIGFLSGVNASLCVVVAMFFYKAGIRSRDTLFYYFSTAFALFALERMLLTFSDPSLEMRPLFYILRLIAFLTIIYGIWKKNIK